jgi:hypothetical protein
VLVVTGGDYRKYSDRVRVGAKLQELVMVSMSTTAVAVPVVAELFGVCCCCGSALGEQGLAASVDGDGMSLCENGRLGSCRWSSETVARPLCSAPMVALTLRERLICRH